MPSVSLVSGNRQTAISVWLRNGSSWSRPWKIGISACSRGVRTHADTGKPSDFSANAGTFAIMP